MGVEKRSFKLLVAIVNHNHNRESIVLKNSFKPLVDTVLIDSGSTFEDGEKGKFDYLFENIYYNGLLNQAHKVMHPEHTHLLLITSDVQIEDYEILLNRIKMVYNENPEVAVYAPSANYSSHHHAKNLGISDIRKVTFTDGFCLVMPKEYLNEMCPIDLEVNKMGHGIDVYMGYLAMKKGKWTIVDDYVTVSHPHGSSYNDKQARIERDRWYATKSKSAQCYHYWVSKDILKNKLGYWFVKFLMRF